MQPSVEALLAAQHGLVTHRQLCAECGATDDQVRQMARGGRLRRISRGLYASVGAPRTPEFAATAAMLRCGPNARLIGPRVLSLLDLRGFRRDAPFGVLVPRVGRRRTLDIEGERILVVTDPAPGDRTDRVGCLRIPSPGRSMVEVARFLEGADLRAAIDAGRSARRPTLRQLYDTVAALPENYVPAARMRAVLADEEAFQLESEGERAMRRALGPLARHFEWQVHLAPDLRVDCLQRVRRLVLEYDGREDHASVAGRRRDIWRDGRIRELAYRPVHVTHEDVAHPRAFRRWVTDLLATPPAGQKRVEAPRTRRP